MKPKKTKKQKKRVAKKPQRSNNGWMWLGAALVLTLLAMIPVFSTELLNYDDELYITENIFIQNFKIGDLFGGFFQNQYSPIAMTLMAFWYKLGLSVGALKFISVLWHLLNVALVFLVVRKLFGKEEWAFFVAALFGVSTMQLESVAWLAASMKIGTYGFFFLGAVWLYLRYLDALNKKFLFASIGAFLLACLCKEQAVALAPTLVLVDYFKKRNWLSGAVLMEKVPYFILAIIFGVITLKASASAEVKHVVYDFNIGERLLFAAYALGSYFTKLTIPFNLSFFYTYPIKGATPAYFYIYALIFIAILGVLFQAWRSNNRTVLFALLFFLINIGLTVFTQILSVRDVIMADRYVYISSIGWFLFIAYCLEKFLSPRLGKSTTQYLGIGLIAVMTVVTFLRGSVWKDSISVFSDVIEKGKYTDGKKNPYLALPYNNRGIAYKRKGNIDQAMKDFNSAIGASNKYPSGFLNRGNIYFSREEDKLAIKDYNQTIKLDANSTKALSARGAIYAKQGKNDLALQDLNKAIELEPYFADALSNRGLLYMQMSRYDESIADFSKIISFRPRSHEMYSTRGVVYGRAGRMEESIADHTKAIQLDPKSGAYFINRAYAYAQVGNKAAALQDAQKAKSFGANVSQDFIDSLK